MPGWRFDRRDRALTYRRMWTSPGAARFVAIQQAAVDAYCAATSSMLAATERMALLSLATGRDHLPPRRPMRGDGQRRTMPESFLVHATLAWLAKVMVFRARSTNSPRAIARNGASLSKAHVTGFAESRVPVRSPSSRSRKRTGILATAETATANLTTILRRLNELMEADVVLSGGARQGQVSATGFGRIR